MYTYISNDHTGNERLQVEVVPHFRSLYRSLLATTVYQDATELAAKIHKFLHAHPDDIKEILRDVGRLDAESSRTFDDVFKSFRVCAVTGSPSQRRNVSLTHVNLRFNE